MFYANSPRKLIEYVESNAVLTQSDETVLALSIAYCAVLGLLVTGQSFDNKISNTLVQMVDDGALPFHSATGFKPQPPARSDVRQPLSGQFSSPDALFLPGG